MRSRWACSSDGWSATAAMGAKPATPASAISGIHLAQSRGQVGDLVGRVPQRPPPGVGRIVREAGPGPPRAARPDRTRHEPATAVRADVLEDVVHAPGAERALVAA